MSREVLNDWYVREVTTRNFSSYLVDSKAFPWLSAINSSLSLDVPPHHEWNTVFETIKSFASYYLRKESPNS